MEKKNFTFKTGQYITLDFSSSIDRREYSIYNAEQDDYIEVLIKDVENGLLSKKLKKCKPDDKLDIDGAFGHLSLKGDEVKNKKFMFICTGTVTDISPIHNFMHTHPEMD